MGKRSFLYCGFLPCVGERMLGVNPELIPLLAYALSFVCGLGSPRDRLDSLFWVRWVTEGKVCSVREERRVAASGVPVVRKGIAGQLRCVR